MLSKESGNQICQQVVNRLIETYDKTLLSFNLEDDDFVLMMFNVLSNFSAQALLSFSDADQEIYNMLTKRLGDFYLGTVNIIAEQIKLHKGLKHETH